MKALFYKDLLLLWKQGKSMALWAAVVAVVSYRVLDGGLAVANGMLLLLVLLVVPADLGAHWLEHLPISPRARVWSKYLLLWGLMPANFLLVLAASVVSPSAAVTQKILVTFLVYVCVVLALQAVFFPVLAMYGPASKGAWHTYFVCCFLAYLAGLIPLGLVRETPLAVSDVLPYVGIAFAASVISAPIAVSQYRKEWR